VDVIIIDEMSMMTIVQLTTIYSRLKQASKYNPDPFYSKILLYMGNMAYMFLHGHRIRTNLSALLHHEFSYMDIEKALYIDKL
jgi:NAD dependent epimerase/dehydratase family enzyme